LTQSILSVNISDFLTAILSTHHCFANHLINSPHQQLFRLIFFYFIILG